MRQSVLADASVLLCRIHPKEVMTFTVDRQGQSIDIPVKPAEAPDGTGRIGVQLAANAQISHITSKDPLQAVQLAGKQFAKLTKTVVGGQYHVYACLLQQLIVCRESQQLCSRVLVCHAASLCFCKLMF